jgi:hypothetical protein
VEASNARSEKTGRRGVKSEWNRPAFRLDHMKMFSTMAFCHPRMLKSGIKKFSSMDSRFRGNDEPFDPICLRGQRKKGEKQ